MCSKYPFSYRYRKFELKNLRKIIGKLSCFEHRIDSYRQLYECDKRDIKRTQNVDLPQLSEESKRKISSFWRQYVKYPIKDTYYRTIVYILGKEPENLHQFISPYIMYVHMMVVLNPREVVNTLSDKLMLPLLFPSVKQPRIIVGNYRGSLISTDYTPLSVKQAIDMILKYGKPIIIKQSNGSFGGKGIEIYDKYDENTLIKIFETYKKNYIIQEVIEQSDDLAIFNPTSLNTIRVTTLLINGKCSVLSKMLRHGNPGMRVDNMSSGGFGIGISNDGYLTFATSDTVGLRKEEHILGFKYNTHKIPSFSAILETAVRLHYNTPQCGMIGWDFALDKYNTPILIETNIYRPEISSQQILEGKPIFGERTQEVLDYCFNTNNRK